MDWLTKDDSVGLFKARRYHLGKVSCFSEMSKLLELENPFQVTVCLHKWNDVHAVIFGELFDVVHVVQAVALTMTSLFELALERKRVLVLEKDTVCAVPSDERNELIVVLDLGLSAFEVKMDDLVQDVEHLEDFFLFQLLSIGLNVTAEDIAHNFAVILNA